MKTLNQNKSHDLNASQKTKKHPFLKAFLAIILSIFIFA